jgi:hypothetical protein
MGTLSVHFTTTHHQYTLTRHPNVANERILVKLGNRSKVNTQEQAVTTETGTIRIDSNFTGHDRILSAKRHKYM